MPKGLLNHGKKKPKARQQPKRAPETDTSKEFDELCREYDIPSRDDYRTEADYQAARNRAGLVP